MLGPPIVTPVLDIDVEVVRSQGPAGEGTEHVYLGQQAQRPFVLASVENPQKMLGQLDRPFALHQTSFPREPDPCR